MAGRWLSSTAQIIKIGSLVAEQQAFTFDVLSLGHPLHLVIIGRYTLDSSNFSVTTRKQKPQRRWSANNRTNSTIISIQI